jgi:hypothetical protein
MAIKTAEAKMKMKLTNKILLILFGFILVTLTVAKVVLEKKIEVNRVPSAPGAKTNRLESNFSDFNVIEIKGKYNATIYKGDFNKIEIEGPENLIFKYTSVEKYGDKVIISSGVDLSKYGQVINVTISVKDIKSVSAYCGSIVELENITADTINITATDSSLVNSAICSFTKANIFAKDNALVFISKTKNAYVQLSNYGRLSLEADGSYVTGTMGDKAEMILTGKVKVNNIDKSKLKANQQGALK